eukprot:TRINITY_DN18239_c1_g1_i1.p1 TRINITY_DN18239_c1_g1~~TRINITY_DN18239_c1_g1_i1.p1  ORF type:complete len:520 (+),score=100.96 TRINITY_DN18239_c1_g1_i1:122-1681(+)
MVDIFLLVLVVAVVIGSLVVNTKVLFYFQQPEDSRFASSVVVKAIIVISLTLAWLVVLLLPIDVRNARPVPGPLDMQPLWIGAFITLIIFLVIIVPAAMFYAEVEGDDLVKGKKRHVLCQIVFMLIVSTCLIAVSYRFLADADLPVVRYACGDDFWLDASDPGDRGAFAGRVCEGGVATELSITVGFDIYLVAVLCFIGWGFVVIFGGIGLSAVPLDLILAFKDRPKAINEATYQQRRRVIGQATTALLSRAEELQAMDSEVSGQSGWRGSRRKRQLKADYNRFKRDVLMLEEEHEKLAVAKFQRGENLAVSVAKLLLGIFAAILSLSWVLHIVLYIVTKAATADGEPVTLFLNALLSEMEGALYPLGVSVFAVFVLYLLICVVCGCLKFGMRFFFLISIHPMRYKATPLNSILFNVEMVLLCSAAVVQFAQQAFADYARLTSADVIFAAQIKYLRFYSWFFKNNVFIYTLLSWFVLALIYLLVRPREVSDIKFDAKTDKKLHKMAGTVGKPGADQAAV